MGGQPPAHDGTCSPFPPPPSQLPRLPNFPASEAAIASSFPASPARALTIDWLWQEKAVRPAAVAKGFRCEARAGEAVGTSAVRCVSRSLGERGNHWACGPQRSRSVVGITPIPREGSGRGGAGLRSLRMRWRAGRAAGGRAGRGWLRVRGGPRGAWGPGEGWESSVPPRQSPALSLSRARPAARGSSSAGKRLGSRKEPSPAGDGTVGSLS